MLPQTSPMKSIISLTAAFVITGAVNAADNPWKPTKPVEIVIGAQAGGAHDRSGRVLQKILTDTGAVSVPVNVINKPGQGQAIAVAYTNAHAGDPHYLIILGSSWVTTAINTGSTTSHRDLTPITKLFDTDLVLYVPSASPMRHAEAKKFADANNWTIELTNAKDMPALLDKEYAKLRKTLVELGMAQ